MTTVSIQLEDSLLRRLRALSAETEQPLEEYLPSLLRKASVFARWDARLAQAEGEIRVLGFESEEDVIRAAVEARSDARQA